MLFPICFSSLTAVIMLLYSNPVLTAGIFLCGVTIVLRNRCVLVFSDFRTKISKRGGPGGDAWSSTTLKTQCKTRLKAFLSQAYLSKRLLKKMKFSTYFIKFIDRIFTYLAF